MINNTIGKEDWVWDEKTGWWDLRADVLQMARGDTEIGFVPDGPPSGSRWVLGEDGVARLPVTQAECDRMRANARVEQDKLLAEELVTKRRQPFDGKRDVIEL